MQFSEQVLAKNHQYCIINKPAGQPVQPDKTGDNSTMDMCKKYFHHDVYLVHRIDRPVSGLVLFAKNTRSAAWLSELFRSKELDKTYLAIVENEPPHTSGSLVSRIIEKKTGGNKSRIGEDNSANKGREAITKYEVIGRTDKYTLLAIKPVTGRKHQIRAQLAEAGCPIQGDVKYGARRGNKDRSIGLHAWRLSFTHPITGEIANFEAPLPNTNLWQACAEILKGESWQTPTEQK